MESYIEVIGESSYTNTVKEYVADINLSVRAVKSETAFDEVIGLRNRCIETLLSSGLEHSKLQEGGAEAWQSWYQRKQPEQEVYQKIIVSCQSMSRLMKALSAIEPLFDNQRYKFTLNMRCPIFGENEEKRDKARREAIKNAHAHAMILAEESNLQLGETIKIEEIRAETQSSGVYGDEYWGMMAAAGSSESYNDYSNLDSASQTIKLKYKVRYNVATKSSN